jgi:hypothetical protein
MKISKKESELRRSVLPYGAYIGADGTETLFDRSYAPMLQRDDDGKNLRKGTGWIEHTKQVWFYDDYCSPHYIVDANKDAYYRCMNALAAFIEGKPITPYVYKESQ